MGHEELVEHVRGEAGGFLRLQVAVAVRGQDGFPLPDLAARDLVGELRTAGAVALVAVVVERQQALLFLPPPQGQVVLGQEGQQAVDGLGVHGHLEVELLHAHQVDGLVGDAVGVERAAPADHDRQEAREDVRGQFARGVRLGRFRVRVRFFSLPKSASISLMGLLVS